MKGYNELKGEYDEKIDKKFYKYEENFRTLFLNTKYENQPFYLKFEESSKESAE